MLRYLMDSDAAICSTTVFDGPQPNGPMHEPGRVDVLADCKDGSNASPS